MGEMILEQLLADNPKAPFDQVSIYADALIKYIEAEANIRKNGSIVAHPRTGAPIDNPYLKIQSAASKQMLSCGRIKETRAAWQMAQAGMGEQE